MESLSRNIKTAEAAQAKYFIPNGSSLEVCEKKNKKKKTLITPQNVTQNTQERKDICKWGPILNQDVKLSTDLLNPSFSCV